MKRRKYPGDSSSSATALTAAGHESAQSTQERELLLRAKKQYKTHLLFNIGLLPWMKLYHMAQ